MCVILHIPKDVRPSLETLRLCERANPHGGGLAWRNAGSVEWLKTNDVAEIDKLARKLKGELVIHFRIASIGGVCNELRHPFPVTRKASLAERGRTGAVLFQNGTWSGYHEALRFAESEGHKAPEGEMSDARAAAFLVSIYGHKFLMKRGSSRWVYMSGTETIRYGDWYKRDGIFFSNLYWLPPAPPKRQESDFTSSNRRYHRAEQFEFAACEPSRSELYDMHGVQDYWSKLTNHSAKANSRVKPGQKACNCCEGLGQVIRAGKNAVCPLCNGTGVQPKDVPTPADAENPKFGRGETVMARNGFNRIGEVAHIQMMRGRRAYKVEFEGGRFAFFFEDQIETAADEPNVPEHAYLD